MLRPTLKCFGYPNARKPDTSNDDLRHVTLLASARESCCRNPAEHRPLFARLMKNLCCNACARIWLRPRYRVQRSIVRKTQNQQHRPSDRGPTSWKPRFKPQRGSRRWCSIPGLARVERPADMISFIRRHLYEPEYPKQAAAPPKAA